MSATTTTAVSALSEHDVLKLEKDVLGFYFSGHPLLGVQHKLKSVATHDISKLSAEITAPVRVCGLVNQVKRMVTKAKGEQWCSGELEDLSGEIRLLVFPRAYASGLGQQLQVGGIVAVTGRLSFRGEGPEAAPELIVEEIAPLDFALLRYAKRLRLLGDPAALSDEQLEKLRGLLEDNPGQLPVSIEHETPEGLAVLDLDGRVRLSQALLDGFEKVLGPKCWRVDCGAPVVRPPARSYGG